MRMTLGEDADVLRDAGHLGRLASSVRGVVTGLRNEWRYVSLSGDQDPGTSYMDKGR